MKQLKNTLKNKGGRKMGKQTKWTDEANDFIKANAHIGHSQLALHFGVRKDTLRKHCLKIGVYMADAKSNMKLQNQKPDNNATFNHKRHVIKNSDTSGQKRVWVPELKANIFIPPGKDQTQVINKFLNRASTRSDTGNIF